VEFYYKNKLEKLVHLVGFVIRILDGFFWLYIHMMCPTATFITKKKVIRIKGITEI